MNIANLEDLAEEVEEELEEELEEGVEEPKDDFFAAERWMNSEDRYQPYEPDFIGRMNFFDEKKDGDFIIACAECGKDLKLKDAQTSPTIFNKRLGVGYAICLKCHQKEKKKKSNN